MLSLVMDEAAKGKVELLLELLSWFKNIYYQDLLELF